MAEYRIQFTADASAAGRSISDLRKAVKAVATEFEKAEIGSKEFADSASQVSRLKKELRDASSAVVNIDKAYQQLNKAIEANLSAYEKAGRAAVSHHQKLLDIVQDSFKQEDALRDKNYKAELADWDRRLNAAASARKKMAAQQRSIMEFRAGMGARGAISGVASPVGGAFNIPGSPLFEQKASLASLERKLEELRSKARLIAPDTPKWRQLNDELLKTERSVNRVNRMQRGGPSLGQRASAAGGAFLYGGGLGGGIGSMIGGVGGGIAGGVPGAFAGAAIGQAVDNMGTALAGVTTQAAAIQQLQRGLAMASTDARDFAEAQAAVGELSGRILMPMEQTLRMFTQLRINTKEYNMSVAETARIMEGTALAIQSTGGSTQDMEGAMRAVVQIMSKGSVQAEELRGQLGERFPGAVVKFAKANNMSFEELQDALQAGRVGIAEFIKFAEQNYEDYAQFSQQLATAPEFAGKRLAIAFEQMQIAIGSTMGDAGAIIQDALAGWLTSTADWIKENEGFLRQLGKDFAEAFKLIVEAAKFASWAIEKAFMPVFKVLQDLIGRLKIAMGMAGAQEYATELARVNKALEEAEKRSRETGDVRALSRVGNLRRQKAELEAGFKAKGGDAALRGPAMTYGGPGAGVPTSREGTDNAEAERRAKAYLDAVERREEGMAKAREDLETSLADIRKRAVEEVASLERQYADRRRQVERDIAKTRRDLAFELQQQEQERGAAGRILAGESPDLIEAERELAQALNQYTEEKIGREEKAQDEQIRKARELEDFRVKISQAINEANQRYAKQIGEIQKAYAQTVAKLISDGSGQGAKRLEAAGRITAALLRQATAQQAFLAAANVAVIPPSTGNNNYTVGNISFDASRFMAAGAGVNAYAGTAAAELVVATKELQIAQQALTKAMSARAPSAGSPRVANIDTSDLDATIQAEQRSLDALMASAEAVQDSFAFVASVQATIGRLTANYAKDLTSIVTSLDDQNSLLEQQLAFRRQGLSIDDAEQQAQTVVALEKHRERMDGLIAQAKQLNRRTEVNGALTETIVGLEKERDDNIRYFVAVQDLQQAKNKLITLQLEQQLAIEQKITEEREAAVQLIQQAVSGAMSSYKQFVGEVLKGRGLKDAVLQLQTALRDQAVTMFLDFAFKPMEKMMEEQLRQFFDLPSEEQMRQQQISKLQEQIVILQQIRDKITGPGAVAPSSTLDLVKPDGTPYQPTPAQGSPGQQPSVQGLPVESYLPVPTTPHSQRIYDPRVMSVPAAELLTGQGGSDDQMPDLASAADAIKQDVSVYSQAILAPAKGIGTATNFARSANQNWQQSLGATVQSIGMAAGAVMSIAAGVSQIKRGGVSGVLGGIGSILMGVGGAMGGFSKLGGLFGGGGVSAPNLSGLPQSSVAMGFAANGAVWKGGFTPFANGGIVQGPTLGLVGEGKYNEAIVPLPDGRSIPVKMAGGQSAREAMQTGGMASAGPSLLSFSFETTNIGGVEYVSRDQLELAMAATRKEAAKEGAKRGMDMTMDKIRNSPAARQNIAMGRR